jgi:23S rRNA-/tRNA-specific pseudouridylate synthase
MQSDSGRAAGNATVQRTYWAIVETGAASIDALPDSGRFVAPIWGGSGAGGSDSGDTGMGGGWRPAATVYRVVGRGGGYALLELRPETGVPGPGAGP